MFEGGKQSAYTSEKTAKKVRNTTLSDTECFWTIYNHTIIWDVNSLWLHSSTHFGHKYIYSVIPMSLVYGLRYLCNECLRNAHVKKPVKIKTVIFINFKTNKTDIPWHK